MKLALFDLDNTLLPIDSDYSWSQFLVNRGILSQAEYETRNAYFYEQYKAGTLNISEFLDFQLKPLTLYSRSDLNAWRTAFLIEVIEPNLHQSALELVNDHQRSGHLCALVTATNSFIAGPIAALFGIKTLIATEPEEINGHFTGKVVGIPSFREGKVHRTEQWLQVLGKNWLNFDTIYVYTDSVNDLPLMEKATDPVATNPDETLALIAIERGWRILRLFT